MSLNSFLQIFWARRLFIGLCGLTCLVGAIVISMVLPPIWQASGRVMLNLAKADPVTGEAVAGAQGGSYISTQMSLITDPQVLGKVADALGWTSDPNLMQSYQARSHNDKRDFRSYLADTLAQNTQVKPIRDSNILEVTYNGSTPEGARSVVENVLKAYIETSTALRSEQATKTADFYEQQLQKVKAKLDEAVTAETSFERKNGLVMSGDKSDVESQRLQSLAAAGNPVMLPPSMADASKPSEMELAQLDAQIAAASKSLGPNNPDMVAMTKKRSELVQLVRKDNAAVRAANAASASGAGQIARELAAQKSRVVADSEKIGKLQTLQQDVDVRRADYQQAAAKLAVNREAADQTQSNSLTNLGVQTPKSPLFPNWPLVIVGSFALGLALGVGVALLLELLNPKVRSVDDLTHRLDAPVIAVVSSVDQPRAFGARRALAARRRASRGSIARA